MQLGAYHQTFIDKSPWHGGTGRCSLVQPCDCGFKSHYQWKMLILASRTRGFWYQQLERLIGWDIHLRRHPPSVNDLEMLVILICQWPAWWWSVDTTPREVFYQNTIKELHLINPHECYTTQCNQLANNQTNHKTKYLQKQFNYYKTNL